MNKRVFGFDLGIASIGWAVVDFFNFEKDCDEDQEGKIIKSGVRIFPVSEEPKTHAPLSLKRRVKRLTRRTIRRKARRMSGIKNLFIAKGLVSNLNELNDIYAKQIGGDVWNLRVAALNRKLSKEELIRVLTHLAKHRGFLSYRKNEDSNDAEQGKILKAISESVSQLNNEGAKTLAELIVKRAGETGKKRNYTKVMKIGSKADTSKVESFYINSIPRLEIQKETKLIFEAQNTFNGYFTKDLFDDYWKIAFRYQPIQSMADMVGFCTLEPKEKRAPKQAPSSELFVALSKINNLSLYDGDKIRFPTDEERAKIIDLLQNTKNVTYGTLQSKIFKGLDIQFRDIKYSKNEDDDKREKENKEALKKTFYKMEGWHTLKRALTAEQWDKLKNTLPVLDSIVNVIACEKDDKEIKKALEKLGISSDIIDRALNCNFSKFINLSFKAIYNLIPKMEKGLIYNKACEECGYDFKKKDSLVEHKGITLEAIPQEKLTLSPVVNRTVSQFRKVYNALVRKYGLPDQINIEMGRELKKSKEERLNIEKRNKENNKKNEKAIAFLTDKNFIVNSKNILKYKLYEEQNGRCIYSNEKLDLDRIFLEDHYVDVDHILPYSKTFDDSFNNKVLCLSRENTKKGNKTPYEYLSTDSALWASFIARVKVIQNKVKVDRLLNKTLTKVEVESEFIERNANDNSYIARYVKQYCEDGIDFSSSKIPNLKMRVQVRSGFVTDFLRHQWGLKKDRQENDRHHAQDAIVIACATPEMVQRLSRMSAIFENKYKYQQKNDRAWYEAFKIKYQNPWPSFRQDVTDSLDEIFISRPPRKKATGELHSESIYTLNEKSKKFDPSKVKSGVNIRGGKADNGSILRVDVFSKANQKGKEEFFLIPIYLTDLGKENLPNKAIAIGKPESEWLILDDAYTFKFSLYSDDLVLIENSKKEQFLGYFVGCDRSTGAITLVSHDRSKQMRGIGVKRLNKFTKYDVDVLGNYHEVKKETRQVLTLVKKNRSKIK